MPVKQYNSTRPPDQASLVSRLAQEWQTPNSGASEPVILEESDAKGKVVHVYVVWSDWSHLRREFRGEVIMDAAERVKLPDEVLNITIAMGLTPSEADSFGIKWR
jgi:hypothetical protein